jgi:hypothetical protein
MKIVNLIILSLMYLSSSILFGQKETEENKATIENKIPSEEFSNLIQLIADEEFLVVITKTKKLLKKPKYAKNPELYIILAKGHYGVSKKDLKLNNIQDPLNEAISSTATAIKMDNNGTLNCGIYKHFLEGIQKEVFNSLIVNNLEDVEGFLKFYNGTNLERKNQITNEIDSGIRAYSSISKFPFASRWIEANFKYYKGNLDSATILFNEEFLNFMKIKNLDNLSETDREIMKTGIILSAETLPKIDGNKNRICQILDTATSLLGEYSEFKFLRENHFNCAP